MLQDHGSKEREGVRPAIVGCQSGIGRKPTYPLLLSETKLALGYTVLVASSSLRAIRNDPAEGKKERGGERKHGDDDGRKGSG